MSKYSLVYDGFSVPESRAASEVVEVLSQALESEPNAIEELLAKGSGILKESDDETALRHLADLCTSLGLNCTVVFGVGALSNPGSTAAKDSGSNNATSMLVDDLVQQLEHTTQLQNDSDVDLSKVTALLRNEKLLGAEHELGNELTEVIPDETDGSETPLETASQDPLDSPEKLDPVTDEPVKQFDWGHTDALTFIKKSKRTDRLVDIASAVIIAFLTALLTYFINDDSQFEERIQEQQKYVESLLKNLEAEQKVVDEESTLANKEDEIPSAKLLVGLDSKPSWELVTEFFTDADQVRSIDIKIETPPPAHLTDEEIVNRVEVRPWLRRLLISNMAIKQKGNRKFIATGKARAFIEHKHTKLQSLSEVVVTGELSEKQTEITGRLMVNRGFQQIPQGDQVIVEALEGGDYKYFVGLAFSASFQPTK